MKRTITTAIATIFLVLAAFASPAQATISLDETLKATDNCEALKSIREHKNPGNVKLTTGNRYQVIGKNKEDETHYLLKMDDVSYNRWVEKSCGKIDGKNGSIEYVLALSWQPAFCETGAGRGKPECEKLESRGSNSFAASNFTLHGLWPQQDFDPADNKPGTGRNNSLYCGVSSQQRKLDENYKWKELSAIGLTEAKVTELKKFMPGVASELHRHEWYKHGTCYSDTPEEYYNESLALQAQINNSQVRDLFANNIGNYIAADEIRQAFDKSFGSGAGDRIKIDCSNSGNIEELKINLAGTIETSSKISDLLSNASPVTEDSCNGGQVDRFSD